MMKMVIAKIEDVIDMYPYKIGWLFQREKDYYYTAFGTFTNYDKAKEYGLNKCKKSNCTLYTTEEKLLVNKIVDGIITLKEVS